MSSMRNLKIVILTPDPERFRGALTLAAAQAALGASVRSEEHTSELQSLMRISYAVFCLKKKKQHKRQFHRHYGIYTTHHTSAYCHTPYLWNTISITLATKT